MEKNKVKQAIIDGDVTLGIELGSTRIKAVLIGTDNMPFASGSHTWENRFENGVWTYHLEDVWKGLQDCYQNLAKDVKERFGVPLTKLRAIGFSAMMHGYLVFDKAGEQLTTFRTWRNTMTEQAAEDLTEKFGFNIPQRWSIAHLYQAILNSEQHVPEISFLTTLAGYVHWRLTGKKVIGIGDASGVFPIDSTTNNYNANMIQQFYALITDKKYTWTLESILPKVLAAGETAGSLTVEGAKLLDITGQLQAGIPLCPPEGDAGTGMVATNSVAERTGNVSAGTSIFAMVVLEKALSAVYPEIDMVTTPTGKPVAMVHCNNCTTDLNAWVGLFGEILTSMGVAVEQTKLYEMLYDKALHGDADCGGLLSYNYYSGESITHFDEGRPLFVRAPESNLSVSNFMRSLLFSAMATLKLGMNILFEKEHVHLDNLLGHGGFFKTKVAGQKLMAAAVGVPVAVMETAGEGGAWGIALLASYMANRTDGETLENYLTRKVFAGQKSEIIMPDKKDEDGFALYMQRYEKGLVIERAAVDLL